MQQTEPTKGFFTFAQNTDTTDYVRLAYGLALSLMHSQEKYKGLTIGITPGTKVDKRYEWAFDNIIEIPWGDNAKHSKWKLENEWKAIWMTPYDETIKLDSDMLFFSDITTWWNLLSEQKYDIVFANTVLNWRGEPVVDDYYRKAFTHNSLPNIYTACSYFRKSKNTMDLFSLAKIIYWNWEKFFETFLGYEHRPAYPSTDVIFAIAMKILDNDSASYRPLSFPVFTHMKNKIQGWSNKELSEDWREYVRPFFTQSAVCKIGNHRQFYPLHYHIKEFLTDDMLSIYEGLVKNG